MFASIAMHVNHLHLTSLLSIIPCASDLFSASPITQRWSCFIQVGPACTWEMTQWGPCLLFRNEDLSSETQHPAKRIGLLVCTVILAPGDRNSRICKASWLAGLAKSANSRFNGRHLLLVSPGTCMAQHTLAYFNIDTDTHTLHTLTQMLIYTHS